MILSLLISGCPQSCLRRSSDMGGVFCISDQLVYRMMWRSVFAAKHIREMPMLLRFESGSATVYSGEADCIPPAGSSVVFRMSKTTQDAGENKLVEGVVSSDRPARYDFDTLAPLVIVHVHIRDIFEAFE